MEKYIKQFAIVSALLASGSGVFAGEADPNYAQTQKICECFEKTGSANCKPLNATNTESANRQAGAQGNGDGGGQHTTP